MEGSQDKTIFFHTIFLSWDQLGKSLGGAFHFLLGSISRGVLPMMAYTGRLHMKEVLFSSVRYVEE